MSPAQIAIGNTLPVAESDSADDRRERAVARFVSW